MECSKFISFVSLCFIIHTALGNLDENVNSREKEAFTACVLDLSLTLETTHHLVKTGDLLPESHPDTKCVFLCVAQKLNVTDDSGSIHEDRLIAYVPEAYIPEINAFKTAIASCSKRSETDPCDKWYQFFQCVQRVESDIHSAHEHRISGTR